MMRKDYEMYYNERLSQCEVCLNKRIDKKSNCGIYEEKPDYVLNSEKECLKYSSENPLVINSDNIEFLALLGGIFGFCIGDVLGVPVEFLPREEMKKNKVNEMRAYGTYDQYFGAWSDDTSLTLCLIDSLRNGYNITDIADKFMKFYYRNLWTPFGEVFDIGNRTALSIEQMAMGVKPAECGGNKESDNGNGSLMRVLPLAYYLKNFEPLKKIEIIKEVSSLTHSHKRSILACIFYVEFAINLLMKKSKSEAYKNSVIFVKEYCISDYKSEFCYFERILNGKADELKEEEIMSGGYVIDTLEAVIWSFLNSEDYKSSVFSAVNLGGDTDTTGAITGGLSGIFYGFDNIPDNWVQILARKKDIYSLLEQFYDSRQEF